MFGVRMLPIPGFLGFRLPRLFAGHSNPRDEENDILGVDWVLKYEFGNIDQEQANRDFEALISDLEEAGLRVQVRHGYGDSLLVFLRVPREQLGHMVHQSRVKDFLHSIVHSVPAGDEDTVAHSETPAEELRSVYHVVTWSKELGGAGITPNHGKWENVTASFPLHDMDACSELSGQLNRKANLTTEDLDTIRALFGEKVAFYFAFISSYSVFLIIPTILGILAWLYLGCSYSIFYGGALCIWAVVFVEYWKVRQYELSIRWSVEGVGTLKVNRPEWYWDKEVRDAATGQVLRTYSGWKQFLLQTPIVPFAITAATLLGTMVALVFALELYIEEFYPDFLYGYIQYLPPLIFALSQGTIGSWLNGLATQLTSYENHRTQDEYQVARTQKGFLMSFIISFLPTILTAYVYVPFGRQLVPRLALYWPNLFRIDPNDPSFQIDAQRLAQEVKAMSLGAQVVDFFGEVVMPYIQHFIWQKWSVYNDKKKSVSRQRSLSTATDFLLIDSSDERNFLERVRGEAGANQYESDDELLEMCVQFGFLALFGVAWPLMALGFLVNNWIELRGDLFKLTRECQRPPPIRADSIGPCMLGLEALTIFGTISTAMIVHMYRGPIEEVNPTYLALSVIFSGVAYMFVKFTAKTAFQKIFSETKRGDAAKRYAVRKQMLSASKTQSGTSGSRVNQRVRFHERVNVYGSEPPPSPDGSPSPEGDKEGPQDDLLRGSDRQSEFWTRMSCEPKQAGMKMIRALRTQPVHTGKDFSRAA
ncbi:hypothetical protein N7454_001446 [Penicillium verhagenii]|nr:hypothetical protein N7454_001446 [Penicillium verhagenii]